MLSREIVVGENSQVQIWIKPHELLKGRLTRVIAFKGIKEDGTAFIRSLHVNVGSFLYVVIERSRYGKYNTYGEIK